MLPRATVTGSDGSEKNGTSTRSASTRNCSTAAGRCRSAPTSSGCRPCDLQQARELAAAVVLPEPWSPASITTVGGFGLIVSFAGLAPEDVRELLVARS